MKKQYLAPMNYFGVIQYIFVEGKSEEVDNLVIIKNINSLSSNLYQIIDIPSGLKVKGFRTLKDAKYFFSHIDKLKDAIEKARSTDTYKKRVEELSIELEAKRSV